ncbi:hypothetical protein GGF32_003025 [Allomyces javanicus]|nr:hypothetical protein GGF32_003025 [Allomyces javanicus]
MDFKRLIADLSPAQRAEVLASLIPMMSTTELQLAHQLIRTPSGPITVPVAPVCHAHATLSTSWPGPAPSAAPRNKSPDCACACTCTDGTPRPQFCDLPDEILLKIVAYLRPQSLARLARTCHRFAVLVRDSLLWKNMLAKYRGQGYAAYRPHEDKLRVFRSTTTTPAAPIPIVYSPEKALVRRDSGVVRSPTAAAALFGTSPDGSRNGSSPARNGRQEIPKSLGSFWRDEFRRGYLTHLNWKRGRCRIAKVLRRPGSLHADLDPDRNLIASIDADGSKTWDVTTGETTTQLPSQLGSFTTIKFFQNYTLTGSTNCSVRVWDHATGQLVRAFTGVHTREVSAIDADQTTVTSGSEDTVIWTWELLSGKPLQYFRGHTGPICSLKLDMMRGILLSGSADTTVRVWDVAPTLMAPDDPTTPIVQLGKCRAVLRGHQNEVFCVALASDLVVSGSGDCRIKVWSLETKSLLRTLEGHTAAVIALQVDNNKIISGSADKTIKVWDLHKPAQALYSLSDQHTSGLLALRFNDKQLFASDMASTIVVYDFEHEDDQQDMDARASPSPSSSTGSAGSMHFGTD